jgi:hypothetical protein
MRWNGKAWHFLPTPSPGPRQDHDAILSAVAEVSASDGWAVGTCDGATTSLILRWNGRSWQRVASPR